MLGLEDSDWQFCLHRADLARLDLPESTTYEEEPHFTAKKQEASGVEPAGITGQ